MEKLDNALKFIDDNRDSIVNDIISLAKIPSISVEGDKNYPFGIEVERALNKASELFNDSGFNMQVKSDKGYAVYLKDGIGEGIGLFGHADVVPVNDDWVKTSPFTPIEKNGILYGRGVNDNKAGVIASLYALKALKHAGIDIKSRLTVYVGGSEETGMQDMENFVNTEKMPHISIIPDSDFPVSVGEKGILHVLLKSKKTLDSVKKFEGGKAYNVILDNVMVELCDGEKYSVKGLTAHAAHPEGSENAAYKAAAELLNKDISQNDKEIFSAFSKLIEGYYGENLGIASEGVFNKLTCVNGIVKIEDKRLVFTLDIRYGNEVDSLASIEKIKSAALKNGFEVVLIENNEGFLLDEGGKEMEIILNACREAAEIEDAQPYKTFGGTYARMLKNAFAISHSAPFDYASLNLPKGHGGAHQSDEALSVDALLKGIKSVVIMLKNLDAELTK